MKCEFCEKEFATKQNLQYHLNRKIKCNRILDCSTCKKVFKTKYELDKHLNRKIKCESIDIEAAFFKLQLDYKELKLENKELKLEVNDLKSQNKDLLQLVVSNKTTNNTTNNTANNTTNNNNGTINNININIFGNESIGHITQQLLEKEILKITHRDKDECLRKKMSLKGSYYPVSYITMIDVHLLLTKLIYFTKKKNNTIKKENDKYYINKENGWEEVELDQMHVKTFIKHQEVLVQCKSLILENQVFRKAIEVYFDGDDEFKLKLEVGSIEFALTTDRYVLLNKVLDYELENPDNLEIDHVGNIAFSYK